MHCNKGCDSLLPLRAKAAALTFLHRAATVWNAMMSTTDTLFSGWLWEMFYEYVRKIRRTASTGAPERIAIQEKYKTLYNDASVKFLVEEKVGMIVVFHTLEERTTAQLAGLMDLAELMAYLAQTYGRGKYKINLYHGMTFVATHNFKVEDESLPERWREMIHGAGGSSK